MAKSVEKLKEKADTFRSRDNLDPFEQDHYCAVYEAYLKSNHIAQKAQEALSVFYAEKDLCNYEKRRNATQIIDDCLEIVSAANYPYKITRNDITWKKAPYNCRAVVEFIATHESPFTAFLERRIDQLIAEKNPQAIGVSINYYGQLLAGLEILRIIKTKYPGIITIAGGSLMPEVHAPLKEISFFSGLIDHLICYEGESALLELLNRLDRGEKIDDPEKPISNYVQSSNGKSLIQKKTRESIQHLPLPDFDDLNLQQYLSAHPVLPYLTSRGCYWADCAFCTHFHTYGDDYRTETAAKIVDSMVLLQKKYSTDYFYFVDESLAPSKGKGIAQEILKRNLRLFWGTELRFEKALSEESLQLMAASGCRVLSFGLESGSQRVLDKMGKGVKVEDEHRVIQQAHSNNIKVHVMCIIGFPTETKEEFLETLSLIERHEDKISMIGFSPFTLNVNSIAHRSPEGFGLTVQDEADPFRPDRNYSVQSGLPQKESQELYTKIINSGLIKRIGEKISIPTREHLLFNIELQPRSIPVEHLPVSPGYVVEYTVNPKLKIEKIPFSINLAKAGSEALKKQQFLEAVGETVYAQPAYITHSDTYAIYIEESGQILEASNDLVVLIQSLSDNKQSGRLNALRRRLASVGILKSFSSIAE